jgi:plasmid stabilization system protein ParE
MFEVIMTAVAEAELINSFRYLRRTASRAVAADWLRRILEAVHSLRTMPERCGQAAEADTTGQDVRELLFGRRRSTVRIVFVIQHGAVSIRHIRRATRGPVPPGQF